MSANDYPIIASRALKCVSPSGEKGGVIVEISIPKMIGKSRDWTCDCRISGIEEIKTKTVHGVDSLQCLILATHMVRVQLAFLEKKGFSFSWLGSAGTGIGDK
jgi:hypothetical protein